MTGGVPKTTFSLSQAMQKRARALQSEGEPPSEPAGAALAPLAPSAPPEPEPELGLDATLSELSKIEKQIRFLKLTRPRTDEVLEQKKNEPERLKKFRSEVLKKLTGDVSLFDSPSVDPAERRARIVSAIEARLAEVSQEFSGDLMIREKKILLQELIDEVTGLGPIEQLVRDDSISEIMVNRADQVYVERGGQIVLTPIKFDSDDHLRRIIDRIVSPIGRRIDESSPLVDGRLADGSRVNAIVPPIAIDGASLTIRKFRKVALEIEDLIAYGSLTREMASFLRACVRAHLNIVISGGTGSGKTTLLNTLASFIPPGERIVTIEDAAELQVRQHHEHVVRLESRPANVEGRGAVPIRDLMRNALRMRPDRIVVGECRGGEALDMLQAMNTGHDGSMTTGHANTPRDMIRRLETMVKMSGLDMPIVAIREQIASAVHLIVQANRLNDGSRRITSIATVNGMDPGSEQVRIEEIFVFKQTGASPEGKVIGRHRPTGVVPAFVSKFKSMGIEIDMKMFAAAQEFLTATSETSDLCSLALHGEATREQARMLRAVLMSRAENGPQMTRLSFADVTLVDSGIISVLIEAKKAFADHGFHLMIADLPEATVELFKLMNIYDRLVLEP